MDRAEGMDARSARADLDGDRPSPRLQGGRRRLASLHPEFFRGHHAGVRLPGPVSLGPDASYRHLTPDYVSAATFEGQEVLKVAPKALTVLAREALRDVSFLYRAAPPGEGRRDPRRPGGLGQRPGRRPDPAQERRGGLRLPVADVPGHRDRDGRRQEGPALWTGAKDEEWLSRGIYETYQKENLRYSQTVPLTMYDEVNSETNLPAQIDIFATPGGTYDFLFVAKGGGSANKSLLFQETKALLNSASLEAFLDQKLRSLGTAALPAVTSPSPGDTADWRRYTKSERSFWSRKASRLAELSRAFCSWKSGDLLADPPPFHKVEEEEEVVPSRSRRGEDVRSGPAGSVSELTSSYIVSGTVWE